MIEYKAEEKDDKQMRIDNGITEPDCWSLYSYLTVVFANGIELLAKNTVSYPSDKTPEQWDAELKAVQAKFVWLYNFDDIDSDLHDWCLGDVEMKLVSGQLGYSTTIFTYERPQNYDFWKEASAALEQRRGQIIEEVFDWVKANFLNLWD